MPLTLYGTSSFSREIPGFGRAGIGVPLEIAESWDWNLFTDCSPQHMKSGPRTADHTIRPIRG